MFSESSPWTGGRHAARHFFMAGRHGGHGFGKFGRWMDGFGEGDGWRSGRKLASGDLRLILLALLAERPYHGYELIKALEERSSGFYSPSPGMVYPALTWLEETGHASVTTEGTRKRYEITDDGRTHLEQNRATVDEMFDQLQRIGRRMNDIRNAYRSAQVDNEAFAGATALHDARHELRSALRAKAGASAQEIDRIAAILRRAADEIRGGR